MTSSVLEHEPGVFGHKGDRELLHRCLGLDILLAVRRVGEHVRLERNLGGQINQIKSEMRGFKLLYDAFETCFAPSST